MNGRTKAVEVAKMLQPLVQNKEITANEASFAVKELINGKKEAVLELCNRKSISIIFLPLLQKIKQNL